MNKKYILIVLGLIVAAVGAIFLIKVLVTTPAVTVNKPAVNAQAQPPTTKTVPISGTKDIETWTGVLELGKSSFLKVADKTYTLQVPGADLNSQGYKTGDTVNVMGKLSGGIITVVGMNKLIK